MLNKYIVLSILLFSTLTVAAQKEVFQTKVNIEFEKNLTYRQLIKEIYPEWYDEQKDQIPANILSYHNFIGDINHSIFKPGRELTHERWYRPIADQNIIYNDYVTHQTISQKPVFELTFLVQDSLTKIKWKLTNDKRTIAGFDCRKAIGVLYDSIAVFAFYTDEIPITGGPEGINGLPGMILGVGIPRIHTTWFATKVTVMDVDMSKVLPPVKGKKVTNQGMLQTFNEAMQNDWKWVQKALLNFMI